MQRFAALLALVLAVAVPLGASAKKPKTTAAPAAAGTLSTTPVACPAADPVVWVNTTSKIYWAQGTEYYGKTKHGGYACTSAAIAMGARAPKESPIGRKGATSGTASDAMGSTAATPAPAAGAMKSGKKKHHKGAMAPLPSPSP